MNVKSLMIALRKGLELSTTDVLASQRVDTGLRDFTFDQSALWG